MQLTINIMTAEDLERAVKALVSVGIIASQGPGQALGGGNATAPAIPPGMPTMPPPGRPTALPQPNAMPAMPGPATPPPPPMSAPSANPRLENVVKLMDSYSKGGSPTNGVAGVKKVLAVLGIQRAQDANEVQLEWLEQAFANPAWTPS